MRKISLISLFILQSILWATWFNKVPQTVIQPNGEKVECFVSGDQFYHRLHDKSGYTIVQNPANGYFVYAIENAGAISPSSFIVNQVDPSQMGLIPNLNLSSEAYYEKRNRFENNISRDGRDAPTSGNIEQINVFIKFADDPEFPNPRSYYDAVFNLENEPSLKHYYREVSYNSLQVNTHQFPGTFTDANTAYIDNHERGYYRPFTDTNPTGYQTDAQRSEREHTLLKNAIEAIASQVSSELVIDANNDGYVDAVSFVIYGEPDGWAELLWPHRWALYSEDVYIHGARVWDYLFMLSESWYFNVGVLCHEFFHVLGAPDLYHYEDTGAPSAVGGWDIMESTSQPPQYMSAFMKYKYGDWFDSIPEITESGQYELNPLQSPENTLYKIASPNSDSEYFVVEYRKKEGIYDVNTPGSRSGLVVYRINTEAGDGNAGGPPDEIYVYRPGGTLSANGNFNNAPYSSDYNHTAINDGTNPSSFLYNNGSGAPGGLNIYNVGEAGETISFYVGLGIPHLAVTPEYFEPSIPPNNVITESFVITNEGDDGSTLNYSVTATDPPAFETPSLGPNAGNYFAAYSTDEVSLNYEWVDIDGLGTEAIFEHNDVSTSPILLPFTFPFYDGEYSEIIINPNGWVGFGEDNSNWSNVEIPSSEGPFPAILGFWDDLNPENSAGGGSPSGNVYYHYNEDRLVVWYDHVVRWSTSNPGTFDFQIVLYANGKFRVNYREMTGVVNSATIGFQNAEGIDGLLIAYNASLPENDEFTWAVDRPNELPWLSLDGLISGQLNGGESSAFSGIINTANMNVGYYQGSINVVGEGANTVLVPVNVTVVDNEGDTPTLPVLDITTTENGIITLPDWVHPIFTSVFERYTHIPASNGDVIPILIQNDLTEKQINHVRKILESHLTPIPDSEWGSSKLAVRDSIATSNAILFLLNNEDEYENPNIEALLDAGVDGQDLLATEIFPESSSEYIMSSERDASYEEILHFIHGFGIQRALSIYQDSLLIAMDNAISNNVYNPLWDIPQDHYDEEYLAMGLECYFGLWSHDPNENGYCGDNEYAFITREAMEMGDPKLYKLVKGFFGETLEYEAEWDMPVGLDFLLHREETLDYTYRSQYLKNARLFGDNSINLIGNNYDNILVGNDGMNRLAGYGGHDVLVGQIGNNDIAKFQGIPEEYTIVEMDDTDGHDDYFITDLIPNRDSTCHIVDIHLLNFAGIVYEIENLLDINNSLILPTETKLFPAYPNPFNPNTTIEYHLAEKSLTQLTIIDLLGRPVRTLISEHKPIGKYTIIWNGKNDAGQPMSAGMYFYQMQTQNLVETQKIILIK